MTKTEPYADLEVESKPKCPDCLQPLTFVRNKSQEKKWYCYSCEKYTDHFTQPQTGHLARVTLERVRDLQVIDSRGILVGRVAHAIPGDTGTAAFLTVVLENENLRTLLRTRGLADQVEVGFEKIAAIGDVVILSDAFSLASLNPVVYERPIPKSIAALPKDRGCVACGSPILFDARFCIGCGHRI